MNPSNPTSTSPSSSTNPAAAATGVGSGTPFNQPADENISPVREAIGKGRRQAGAALSQAKEKVGRVVLDQKEMAADRVGGYSSAIRNTARSLEQEDPNVAHFANQAADRIESVADYLRQSDFTRLRHDAEGVARRHPALFMGGLLLAGIVLGNLAKASGQGLRESKEHDEDSDDDNATPDFENQVGYGDEGPDDESYPGAESRSASSAATNQVPSAGNSSAGYSSGL